MVLAPENFRDIEYIVPRAFWEQAGFNIQTSSINIQSKGRFGYKVEIDLLIDQAKVEDFEAIFFVGGVGALDYLEDETARRLAQDFVKAGKVVGAICAACRLLITWDLLDGRECTGHNWDNTMASLAAQHGATYSDEMVVSDGAFVTGYGPEQSEAVALAMLSQLA